MSSKELKVNKDVLEQWATSLPNQDPAMVLAANARIDVKTARKIFEGYVPSSKTRWCVAVATGIPENTLWQSKQVKRPA